MQVLSFCVGHPVAVPLEGLPCHKACMLLCQALWEQRLCLSGAMLHVMVGPDGASEDTVSGVR